ncbi:hypothetical protein DV736_g70, partial [Chaetothyriales sp. CBS 134916]
MVASTNTALPTLAGVFNYPAASVPPTNNAPYLQNSRLPENFVFIVVGAALGFIVVLIVTWRLLTSWSINRKTKQVAGKRTSYLALADMKMNPAAQSGHDMADLSKLPRGDGLVIMSFARPSPTSLRHPVRLSRSLLQLTQRRHARVHDIRFVTTQQPSSAVLEKYRSKLEQKAKKEGLGSVSELKEAYKKKIQEPLSSYIDVSKIQELPAKEIEYIWRLRFASDPLSLCAVVPLSTYQRMQATARQHPQFILPLPRPGAEEGSSDEEGSVKTNMAGFEGGARTAVDVHFLQWATVIFTHLAAFKLHGAYAQPHTTITHHLDLADSHGIVLLNGGVVEGRGVL